MLDPVIADLAPNHTQNRPPFFQRLFRWGIWFWMLAWWFSIFVYLPFVVNLKGWWGMRFFMGSGSVGVRFNSYGTGAFDHIRLEKPMFLWSQPYLDHLRQYPGDFVSLFFGRVGWSGQGFDHTMAFPIAGFLWLWLIGAWMGDFKRIRWNGRMIGRATILASLPLVILFADYRGRRAEETAGCVMNVRNIQQALRGYQGTHSVMTGALIPWSDLFGLGKTLEPYCRECPGGPHYRLTPRMPRVGGLAAECPNPEHQRRIEAMDTSEW